MLDSLSLLPSYQAMTRFVLHNGFTTIDNIIVTRIDCQTRCVSDWEVLKLVHLPFYDNQYNKGNSERNRPLLNSWSSQIVI